MLTALCLARTAAAAGRRAASAGDRQSPLRGKDVRLRHHTSGAGSAHDLLPRAERCPERGAERADVRLGVGLPHLRLGAHKRKQPVLECVSCSRLRLSPLLPVLCAQPPAGACSVVRIPDPCVVSCPRACAGSFMTTELRVVDVPVVRSSEDPVRHASSPAEWTPVDDRRRQEAALYFCRGEAHTTTTCGCPVPSCPRRHRSTREHVAVDTVMVEPSQITCSVRDTGALARRIHAMATVVARCDWPPAWCVLFLETRDLQGSFSSLLASLPRL